MADGGIPGYSSIIYISSENMKKVQTSRVCGTKERVIIRTVPAKEALSRALQLYQVKQVAKVVEKELQIVLAGDSVSVSSLYNLSISIKNILLKSTVVAIKDKCQDIIRIFPIKAPITDKAHRME